MAANTVKAYASDLEFFLNYLKNKNIDKPTAISVESTLCVLGGAVALLADVASCLVVEIDERVAGISKRPGQVVAARRQLLTRLGS